MHLSSCSGSKAGRARRLQLARKRAMFICGLKSRILPFLSLYAFIPSKLDYSLLAILVTSVVLDAVVEHRCAWIQLQLSVRHNAWGCPASSGLPVAEQHVVRESLSKHKLRVWRRCLGCCRLENRKQAAVQQGAHTAFLPHCVGVYHDSNDFE